MAGSRRTRGRLRLIIEAMSPHRRIVGLDETQLQELWRTGLDHGGNPIEPFEDTAGGWNLRCCLRDSRRDDELAVVAWSPFPWRTPYAETGPIVVHARPCTARHSGPAVPVEFRSRRQLLRPYGPDRRIAYDHAGIVEADEDLDAAIDRLLARADVAFVHARSVLSGCYSFAALPLDTAAGPR
jgi:hypothetical protein